MAMLIPTEHETNIIPEVSLGLESTTLPILVITVAIMSTFWHGETSGLILRLMELQGGLYGTNIATIGMLNTAAYCLTIKIYLTQ